MMFPQKYTITTADVLLDLIKKFKKDNPQKDIFYDVNVDDCTNEKPFLDELERRGDITTTQTNDFLIRVELTNKGNGT